MRRYDEFFKRYWVNWETGRINLRIPHSPYLQPVSTYETKNGYEYVILKNSAGRSKKFFAHRAVWGICHQDPTPEGMEIDHLNRFRDDNRPYNLALVSKQENSRRKRPRRERKLHPSQYSLKAKFKCNRISLDRILSAIEILEARSGLDFFTVQKPVHSSNFWGRGYQ